VSARPDTLGYRLSKFVRRNRGGVVAAALIALSLIAAFALTTSQMLEARRQRDIAAHEAERAQAQANLMDQVLTQLADAGEPLTQRLLTDRSVAFVERQYADKPEFAVGFLIHLSGRYMNLGDTRRELETLDKAVRIAERSGDPTLLARAECNGRDRASARQAGRGAPTSRAGSGGARALGVVERRRPLRLRVRDGALSTRLGRDGGGHPDRTRSGALAARRRPGDDP
jgi:serine/threonine-protein kinase